MSSDRRLVHAYGVLRAETPIPAWPSGIADTSVSTVLEGDAVAVTSTLPSEEFDPAAWERNADNAAWLSAVAVGHHRVLQAAVDVGDVVPFRLPSLYGDVDALRQAMHGHAEEIGEAMERVRGRVEWAVKAFGVDDPAESGTLADSGGDYLRARSRQLRTRAAAQERRRQRVGEICDQIGTASVAAVRNAPQDAALTGRREPMVLNAAYLVDRAGQRAFFAVVDEVAQRAGAEGLFLEASGPWPAYNFVSMVDPVGSESA